jgi:hypothetical protein
MLKMRGNWQNFEKKFENYSESGRNHLLSRVRTGVESIYLNTGFSRLFLEVWHPYEPDKRIVQSAIFSEKR